MRNRSTMLFVSIVGMLAIIAGVTLVLYGPPVQIAAWSGIGVLAILAIAADMLGFVLPQAAASGSISFIPFFAAAVIMPSWPAVACIALVSLAVETATRREFTKKVFNVFQRILAEAVAVWVYVSLGGRSLLEITPRSLPSLTHSAGLPALLAFGCGLAINNLLVIGVISVSSGKSLLKSWAESGFAMILMDVVTAPIILFFAWIYALFGWVAAATFWVPILGLRQFHKTNIELERTNEELLQLMVKSLEARDLYTSGHSRRVQHYATIVARAFGLKEREIEQISQAALLHDVGKIHEKYAKVLAKTDQLTQDEWTLIQEHPIDGANLVSTMTRLREIVPAIRSHHENWDGTGYPDGLAGELIPLAARIIRFADTIDAMTTERPYRAPMAEHQVRTELVKCRGSQFDPEITDRLLSSPLWSTLFAPVTDVSPAKAKFAVISARSRGATRARGA